MWQRLCILHIYVYIYICAMYVNWELVVTYIHYQSLSNIHEIWLDLPKVQTSETSAQVWTSRASCRRYTTTNHKLTASISMHTSHGILNIQKKSCCKTPAGRGTHWPFQKLARSWTLQKISTHWLSLPGVHVHPVSTKMPTTQGNATFCSHLVNRSDSKLIRPQSKASYG